MRFFAVLGALLVCDCAGRMADPEAAPGLPGAWNGESGYAGAPGQWDVLAGGIPQKGMVTVEGGFSSVSASVMAGGRKNALGFKLGMEFAGNSPGGMLQAIGGEVGSSGASGSSTLPASAVDGTPGLTLLMPTRFSLYNAGQFSAGMQLDIGFFLRFPSTGLILAGTARLGFTFAARLNQFLIGGGVESTAIVNARGMTPSLFLPMLAGPIAEYHLGEHFAFTADVKVGAAFALPLTGAQATTPLSFALRALAGAAYRF